MCSNIMSPAALFLYILKDKRLDKIISNPTLVDFTF
jgi:hypothetical protein